MVKNLGLSGFRVLILTVLISGNYVFSCDDYLDRQEPEYDTVIAFSVTKWVHLNNGDLGMKRFFRRIYRQLRPGGRLLLEPQVI